MATLLDSALVKLTKKTSVLLPREMSALIRSFEELTASQRNLFKRYLATREISVAQQKAIIDLDPKFAISSLGNLEPIVQAYFLKAYNKYRGYMFKRLPTYGDISGKIIPSLLRHKDTKERMLGDILKSIDDVKMQLAVVKKYPNCLKYVGSKVRIPPELQLIVVKANPLLIKYIISPNAKTKVAALEARKKLKSQKANPDAPKEAKEEPAGREIELDDEIQETPAKPKRVAAPKKESKPVEPELEDTEDELPTPKEKKNPTAGKKEKAAKAEPEASDDSDTDDEIKKPARPAGKSRVKAEPKGKVIDLDLDDDSVDDDEDDQIIVKKPKSKKSEDAPEPEVEEDEDDKPIVKPKKPLVKPKKVSKPLLDDDEDDEPISTKTVEIEDDEDDDIPVVTKKPASKKKVEPKIEEDEDDDIPVVTKKPKTKPEPKAVDEDDEDDTPAVTKKPASKKAAPKKVEPEEDDVEDVKIIKKEASKGSKEIEIDDEDDAVKTSLPKKQTKRLMPLDEDDFPEDDEDDTPKVKPKAKPKAKAKKVELSDDELDEIDDSKPVSSKIFEDLDDDYESEDLSDYIDINRDDDSLSDDAGAEPRKARPKFLDPNEEKEYVNLVKLAAKRMFGDEEFTAKHPEGEVDKGFIVRCILKRDALDKYIKNKSIVNKFKDLTVDQKRDILDIAFPVEMIKFTTQASSSASSKQAFDKISKSLLMAVSNPGNTVSQIRQVLRQNGAVVKNCKVDEYEAHSGSNCEAYYVTFYFKNPNELSYLYVDPQLRNIEISRQPIQH